MENNIYIDLFKSLGIYLEPLSPFYTPDNFARNISLINHLTGENVRYSSNTDYNFRNESKTER